MSKAAGFLVDRFPPSPRRLFDLARKDIDDSMLWEIARADYGYKQEEAFPELKAIRDTGVIPDRCSFQVSEVLALTRWCDPERPNLPPFEPGPSGRRGHQIRLFACAVLLMDTVGNLDDSIDSTLAICLVSAGVLGDDYNEALGSWLTWQLRLDGYPVFFAIALLTVAIRLRSKKIAESDINAIAQWIWTLDGPFPGRIGPPVEFSLQQGFWVPVAEELATEAMKLADPEVAENVRLCALILG